MNNNNAPAFPNSHFSDISGMSLRDYLAAKAMQAILTHGKTLYQEQDAFFHIENVAADAYNIADAMLAERDKE